MRKCFVAGNWKMNLTLAGSVALAGELEGRAGEVRDVTVAVCPPFVYLKAVADALVGSDIALGAQNMYDQCEGAFTGEVSASMLLDVGCRYVILGHSERRHVIGEGDELINAKILKALAAGLAPIVCVGETLAQREAGLTEDVIRGQVEAALNGVSREQIAAVTIAYEPVWAIGTGRTASPEQAQQVHAFIRSLVLKLYDAPAAEGLVIQYGGSVKPENASELMSMPDVDGALVGGASLKAESFVRIVEAARGMS